MTNYINCVLKKQLKILIESYLYLHFRIGVVFGIMRDGLNPRTRLIIDSNVCG